MNQNKILLEAKVMTKISTVFSLIIFVTYQLASLYYVGWQAFTAGRSWADLRVVCRKSRDCFLTSCRWSVVENHALHKTSLGDEIFFSKLYTSPEETIFLCSSRFILSFWKKLCWEIEPLKTYMLYETYQYSLAYKIQSFISFKALINTNTTLRNVP